MRWLTVNVPRRSRSRDPARAVRPSGARRGNGCSDPRGSDQRGHGDGRRLHRRRPPPRLRGARGPGVESTEEPTERFYGTDCGLRACRAPRSGVVRGWERVSAFRLVSVQAWDGDVLIDLLFCPAGVPVTDEVLARGREITVMSVPMRVAAIDDVISTKLLALGEHALDLEQVLQIARSLREAINWVVRARSEDSPYVRAFFTLVEELGIAPRRPVLGAASTPPRSPRRPRSEATVGLARPNGPARPSRSATTPGGTPRSPGRRGARRRRGRPSSRDPYTAAESSSLRAVRQLRSA